MKETVIITKDDEGIVIAVDNQPFVLLASLDEAMQIGKMLIDISTTDIESMSLTLGEKRQCQLIGIS